MTRRWGWTVRVIQLWGRGSSWLWGRKTTNTSGFPGQACTDRSQPCSLIRREVLSVGINRAVLMLPAELSQLNNTMNWYSNTSKMMIAEGDKPQRGCPILHSAVVNIQFLSYFNLYFYESKKDTNSKDQNWYVEKQAGSCDLACIDSLGFIIIVIPNSLIRLEFLRQTQTCTQRLLTFSKFWLKICTKASEEQECFKALRRSVCVHVVDCRFKLIYNLIKVWLFCFLHCVHSQDGGWGTQWTQTA